MLKTLMLGLKARQDMAGIKLSRGELAAAYLKSSTRPAIYFNLVLAALLVVVAPVRHLAFGLPFFPSPLSGGLEWGVLVPSCVAVAVIHARAASRFRPRVDRLLGLLIALGFTALSADVVLWQRFGIPIPHEYSGLFFIAAVSVAGLPTGVILALTALFLPLCVAALTLPGSWTHMDGGFSLYFDLVAAGFALLNARSLRKEAGLSWALNEQRATLNASLSAQVEETRAAFNQLRDAQSQLVQAEKMASLGGLVAGVAHEINTPLGVGVLAASTLRDDMQKMAAALAAGTLNRSQLQNYVAGAGQAAGLILSNLQRASELVGSFKRVAVDRAGHDAEWLDLKTYIGEILASLKPQLRTTPHRIELACPPGVRARLVPGALAQIITNLVLNALAHAFEGVAAGVVTIAVAETGGRLHIAVTDNGSGIPPDILPRIFDPFFTTRRGAGGSGLGLHIVYNLVHQTLGGSITASSEVGVGTRFLLDLPVESAPA